MRYFPTATVFSVAPPRSYKRSVRLYILGGDLCLGSKTLQLDSKIAEILRASSLIQLTAAKLPVESNVCPAGTGLAAC